MRIIGEPGRYFCSGSSTLAVVVNSKRKKQLVKEPIPDPDAVLLSAAHVADEEEPIDEDYDDHHDGEDEVDHVDVEDEPSADDVTRGLMRASVSAPELLDLEFNRSGLKASVNPDEVSRFALTRMNICCFANAPRAHAHRTRHRTRRTTK